MEDNEFEGGEESDDEIDVDNVDGLVNIANVVSASLKKSIKTVVGHLDRYLVYLNQLDSDANPFTSYAAQPIPVEYFTKDLYGKFADYLMKIAKIKKMDTALGYLGKLKNFLVDEYDPVILPFLAGGVFFTRLRFRTTAFYVNKCAKSGEKLSDKAKPMTFQDLQIINRILIDNNTPDSNESRCILTHQYQMMGRVNEPAQLLKNNYTFVRNGIERTGLLVDLKRTKVNMVQTLLLVPSFERYEDDSLHTMATLVIANCDSSDKMYPIMASGSASSYMNRVLSSCFKVWKESQTTYGTDDNDDTNDDSVNNISNRSSSNNDDDAAIDGSLNNVSNRSSSSNRINNDDNSNNNWGKFLTEDLKAHSARSGPAQAADLHKDITLPSIAERGGWVLDNCVKIMGYLSGNVASDQRVALALAHWMDATSGGILPDPSYIPKGDLDLFRRLVMNLTLSAVDHLNEETRTALVITALRYDAEFRNNHPHHTLVSIMDETVERMGIDYTVVKGWGVLIRKAFIDLNAMQMNINDLNEDSRIPVKSISEFINKQSIVCRLVPSLLQRINELEVLQSITNNKLENLQTTVSTVDDKLDQLISLLQENGSNSTRNSNNSQQSTTAFSSSVSSTSSASSSSSSSASTNINKSSNNHLLARYREKSKLACHTVSSVLIAWFIGGLHACRPNSQLCGTISEDQSRMKEFGCLIYYAKRFLPPDTTIEKEPNRSLGLIVAEKWVSTITSMSNKLEVDLKKFLEENRGHWMTKGRGKGVPGDHEEEEEDDEGEGGEGGSTAQPKKSRKREITTKFYATIKKLKSVHISHYPSPSNVQDLVTSESEYNVKDNNEEINNCNSSSNSANNNNNNHNKRSAPANSSSASNSATNKKKRSTPANLSSASNSANNNNNNNNNMRSTQKKSKPKQKTARNVTENVEVTV